MLLTRKIMGGPWRLHVLQISLDMALSLAIIGREMEAHTISVEDISRILRCIERPGNDEFSMAKD